MNLPSKILEEIALNRRLKIEEHMLIVLDNSTQDDHLSQRLQTNNKQFKIAITFLTEYNGIFNVTYSNNESCFKKTNTDGGDFIQITIPPGAYEIESLNKEIKRNVIEEEHFTESDYPFQIKPKVSTLRSNIEISPQGPITSFVIDDNIGNPLDFHETILYKEYKLSPNPVDILSFDNIFLECDVAKGMIY